jgi:hypothetical protein
MILYRPVGTAELELIHKSGDKEFPPRLPEQPIFYPVLNAQYACEIAEKWNTKNGDGFGHVTRFEIDDAYISQFEVHTVGKITVIRVFNDNNPNTIFDLKYNKP